MSKIPEARAALSELADLLRARGQNDCAQTIEDILPWMVRRPYAREAAPVTSRPVDPLRAERIRDFARSNPDMPLQDVAAEFQVNIGRVSEALHGDR